MCDLNHPLPFIVRLKVVYKPGSLLSGDYGTFSITDTIDSFLTGVMSDFVFPSAATARKCSLQLSLAIHLSGTTNEDSDYTAMTDVVH